MAVRIRVIGHIFAVWSLTVAPVTLRVEFLNGVFMSQSKTVTKRKSISAQEESRKRD